MRAGKHRVRMSGIALFVLALTAPGCRRDEPPPPPSKSGDPATATTPPTAPVPLEPKESKPRPFFATPAKPNASPTESSTPALNTPPPASLGTGVDAQDAKNAPSYLPRSNDVSGWIKSDPVIVVGKEQLTQLMSPEAVSKKALFHVAGAAACSYRRDVDGRIVTARVLAVEAQSPDDAFGLTTCASSSPAVERCGGLTRVDSRGGVTYHTWQGRVALGVTIDDSSASATAELRRLVQHIAGRIPREDMPSVVHALPTQGMLPGKQWVVRHLASIELTALPVTPPPDIEAVSRSLGLGDQTLMCVAAYEVPKARRPNTVWLVQYPTAKAATEAFRRIDRLVKNPPSKAWANTMLMPPQGPFLIGTWTAEEESIQGIMPRIAQLLPEHGT